MNLKITLIFTCLFILLTSTVCGDIQDLYIYNDDSAPIWVDYRESIYGYSKLSATYSNFKNCPPNKFAIFGGISYEDGAKNKTIKSDTIVVYVVRGDVYNNYPLDQIISEGMYEADTISGSELIKRDFLVTYPFK